MNRFLCSLLAVTLAWTAAASTRNDDSCDISVLPAATLLLPYFEVDLDDPDGENTVFTITNVTNLDRIARVTLWTDRAYPVLAFNVTLTGYDVQTIDLHDLLAEGVIARTDMGPRRHFSDPDPTIDLSACAPLTRTLDAAALARLQSALTTGAIPGECENAGSAHEEHAVGYATIDVVGVCSTRTAADPEYWTKDIRFDNVFLGDYQQLNDGARSAQGGPLVHIRAVPEGGTSVQRRKSPEDFDGGFERTFYARYQTRLSPNLDGRQPLPSRFAARWITDSSFKIWREGRTGTNATCADYAADAGLTVAEVAVYDEQANAAASELERIELPATSKIDVQSGVIPRFDNGAAAGWTYLDLDRTQRDGFASQAWVISSMRAGEFSVDMDAVALANGCSVETEQVRDDESCDIALLPAATLLLPYFSVDLDDRTREATLFTVTNTSPRDQIARVTLWTDYAVPIVSFNLYLDGFDVQSVHLWDILKNGSILSENACGTQPNQISEEILERISSAFTEGIVPECFNIGNEHDDAIGYATIDVVKNCSQRSPLDEEYWTEDIAWDNVLIGDYQQLNLAAGLAQGSPLVHIRATRSDVPFDRTFYGRYQSAETPRRDGRQPLPTTFATRWVHERTPGGVETLLKIWREGPEGRDATCANHDNNVPLVYELVRFDDAENAVGELPGLPRFPIPEFGLNLPATSITHVADASVYPQLANGATSGWMYLNLDDEPNTDWFGSNWVVTSMRAAGRAFDMDASPLGNGCSSLARTTEATTGTEIIGPRP